MPANLTPQYLEAEARFRKAASAAEKVEAIEEMLRLIPKHKGTEKMQADLKKRLSSLRKESQKKKVTAGQRPFWLIDPEGAGQVVLIGPPNSGKSQLLTSLTRVEALVADYPFSTRTPQVAMMPFEDIQIQLIDMPPIAPGHMEGWQLQLLVRADRAALVFDVNDPELLDQTEFFLKLLVDRELIRESDLGTRLTIVGNKIDQPSGIQNCEAWQELYADRFQVIPASSLAPSGLDSVRKKMFESLEVVRVFTKTPGEKPERQGAPFVLPRGSTVLAAASAVHKDLAERFKFARVWGATRFDGQMVERTYVLEDGDLVEIHA